MKSEERIEIYYKRDSDENLNYFESNKEDLSIGEISRVSFMLPTFVSDSGDKYKINNELTESFLDGKKNLARIVYDKIDDFSE